MADLQTRTEAPLAPRTEPQSRLQQLQQLRRRYTAEQAERMREQMIRACELANNDPETLEIMREMDALPDTVGEEWNGTFTLPKAR